MKNPPDPSQHKPSLLFPARGESDLPQLRRRMCLRLPISEPWPWRECMLTAVNSYLLWAFAWLQFCVAVATFSYRGTNLWYYTEASDPLGLSVADAFWGISIALSVFAVTAVVGATWKMPRLWKRIVCVGIFAGIVIGFSGLVRHLRYFSYAAAMGERNELRERYQRLLAVHYASTDPEVLAELKWRKDEVKRYDERIRRYEDKYGAYVPPP